MSGIERRIRRLELAAFPDLGREIADAALRAGIAPDALAQQVNETVKAAIRRAAETGEDRDSALRAVMDELRRSVGGGPAFPPRRIAP